MINQGKSYFNYPTTILLIDDNKNFLDSLSLILKTQGNSLIKSFVDAKEALTYIDAQSSIYKNYQKFLEVVNNLELDNNDRDRISKINFNNIANLVYNKERYNEASVIIADYLMPQIDGIDFFRKVKDTPAKKILMTGKADYKLAVNAFNDGLINKFIIKEAGMEEKLFESINEFKDKYFHDFSTILLQAFDRGIKKAEQYISVFSNWHANNKISEHYQYDGNGSCLGFDDNGTIHWLLISSEEELHSFINIAESAEGKPSIITDLKSKTKLLFLPTEKKRLLPLSEWEEYMFPITGHFIINEEKFFYSFAPNQTFEIDHFL